MGEIKYLTVRFCCCVGVFLIISILWRMAEVKLYGFTQESIIDSMAAIVLSLGIEEWLFSFLDKEDDEE